MNHKKLYRLYTEEKLGVRRRKRPPLKITVALEGLGVVQL